MDGTKGERMGYGWKERRKRERKGRKEVGKERRKKEKKVRKKERERRKVNEWKETGKKEKKDGWMEGIRKGREEE